MSKERLSACYMCDNARVNPCEELDDYNDLSCISIGDMADSRRLIFCSGAGKAPRIEYDEWNEQLKLWLTMGIYYPKFCPNCGRKIYEYD